MDNVCHSLAGAAIAQAGFARRLPRATLLAVIAANIPDVDAFTYLGSDSAFAVSFRRGWTHGLPALVIWSLALAWAFAWWQRARPAVATIPVTRQAPLARDYLPLAAVAVVSHPGLDWLNTYGVRLLMPFSGRWFYGDTLFIVDPTLIIILAVGWLLSSRMLAAGSPRAEVAARAALAVALVYVIGMKAMSDATRSAVERQAAMRLRPSELMVAPVPFSYTRREVMMAMRPSLYRFRATWIGLHPVVDGATSAEPTGATPEMLAAVRATVAGERFLRWARFPYFVPGSGADSNTVFVGDARYASGTDESWAGIRVPLK